MGRPPCAQSLSSNRLSLPSSGRSTFCSIIAQLTDETQPLFETTLKSRAVSEDSDVRFTCIVTGYPEPEVTWYKDDIELDRYCGLPKYQITHQGNRHTLQLYRCQEEDAAIYQASAQNAKGIVSCSGVLEVGTMTEYKIHQRWFAKLKRKAAAKMREIEQSWKHGKEAAREADTLRKLSPDRFQRKRRLSGADVPVPPAPPQEVEGGTPAAWPEGETEPAQHPGLGLINSFAPGEVTTNGDTAPENGEDGEHGLLTYICEAMELGPQRAPQKESGAKKKKKDEEPKQGQQKPKFEKAAQVPRSSENHAPRSGGLDSCGSQGPVDREQVQTLPRGRAALVPGSSGAVGAREPASTMGTQDKAHDATAPTPAPASGSVPAPGSEQKVYFSPKDMDMESTQAHGPPEEGSQPPHSRESPLWKVPGQPRVEKEPAAPGQLTPPPAPQPTRPFNRKRFAPPKPTEEPSVISKPDSPLSPTSELGPQGTRKPPTQASAPVPTPPARRTHSTRDSSLQGRAGHGTSGEATTVPRMAASSSPSVASLGPSTSGSQGSMEPMSTRTQEEGRVSTDQTAGGHKNVQADERTQPDRRLLPPGDRTQTSQRPQAERGLQVDAVAREGTRTFGTSQDVAAQGRAGTQVGRTQAGEKMQVHRKMEADERTQEDRRIQGEERPQSERSVPTVIGGQPEQGPKSSHSRKSRAPTPPSSEGPSPPQVTRHFKQSPEGSSVSDKPGFMLSSEEAVAIASRNHEEAAPGPLSGPLSHPAQLPPERNSEQMGGESSPGLGRSSPVKDKLEASLYQCPKEGWHGEVLSGDLGSCPPAGQSPEAPTMASHFENDLPSSPAEQSPSTLASQHVSTAALPGAAPTPPPGLSTPTQSQPLATVAPGREGACSNMSDVGGGTPSPRSCDPGLIDSLKNYLLLLLKLSGTETRGGAAEPRASMAPGGPVPSPSLAPAVEVAGLSPRTSRRILERVENNHLVQSAQSLLLSPCTSRRLTGLLDREVQASQQALAAARDPQGPAPSPLSIPAIVVGEEGPGSRSEEGSGEGMGQGEEKASFEGPGHTGAAQETSGSGPAAVVGRQVASGQRLLPVQGQAQDPIPEEEASGEALPGLPAATPEELALGARRKRFLPKVRAAGDGEVAKPEERESPTISPRGSRKNLTPGSPGSPGRERCSPIQGRKAGLLEVPRLEEEPVPGDPGASAKAGGLDAEPALDDSKQDTPAKPRKAKDLLKAPQVIRKIRVEQFPDASGSLKLWCQFFNILSDSVLTWAKDQRPVGEVGRSAGDEGPAALAIVQASPVDCGTYRCTIRNEHGSISTDFCLSPEVLSGFISREEGEVGEEIEMTPMVFAKGLADSGCWGDKLFGRLVSEELRGGGRSCGRQKASQAKVIYGLEPIFESGRTCIIKVSSLLMFGPSSETSLLGRNYDVTIQGCKIQNMSREYCKIFAAEARAVPAFGEVPEVIPLYLIYRPANTIPYATLEEDLGKPLESYCSRDWGCAGAPAASSSSEAMQKCQTFQHWLYQWTNGSFLVTDLAGVDWKMTDVQIATRLPGYQGLKESCFPALLDQFASTHQCSTYCEMLALNAIKVPEVKAKGSKSPTYGRKGAQLSPQPQKKGPPSPQGTRKSASTKATPQTPEAVTARLLGQPATQAGDAKAQGLR
ncbi:alpha-protein kinase 3 [Echinops telfairi]|uniref:Alpha-protein kinase 3 n=1 Tax=Echinops telfairi TaxID=9371 RepID=A0AC55CQ12_ECHTE|nr:alpha-protein kinase 3 [Echinops telfairi]